MAEHPTWSVGNRKPDITETIEDAAGNPINLTGATVTFKMRPVGSPTLKVSQPATIVSAPDGTVSYSWAAVDVDTAGLYLVWWTVTAAGLTQDLREALVVFEPHTAETNAYLELEEAKSTLELDTAYADQDLNRAIVAASRTVDEMTGTRFYTTAADEIRYYTPASASVLFIDDLNTLTEFAVDNSGAGTFTAWTLNTDFLLSPLNAAVDGQPWNQVQLASLTAKYLNAYPKSVRITGKFGWPAVPQNVKVATGIVATQFLVQSRSAPLGVISAFDGTAVRISRFGPRVEDLLAPYTRITAVG